MSGAPAKKPSKRWNRCDVCGRIIPLFDFLPESRVGAIRRLITPSAEGTRETYETLCRYHAKGTAP